MQEHTSKTTLDVSGTMTANDAGNVGKALAGAEHRYADAAVLAAKYAGIAALIGAIGYLIGNLHWLVSPCWEAGLYPQPPQTIEGLSIPPLERSRRQRCSSLP